VLVLRTTQQGEALVVELRQKRKERMTEIFSRFTEEEAKTVLQSLKILAKAIEIGEPNPHRIQMRDNHKTKSFHRVCAPLG